MKDFKKAKEVLANMAKTIAEMENECDYSMRGVYLDILVTNYCEAKAPIMVEMFDNIMSYQKDKTDTYGDIDSRVTKLNCHIKSKYPEITTKTEAMFLEDIFCDKKFVIFKILESPTGETGEKWKEEGVNVSKLIERLSQTKFLIKRVEKKLPPLNKINELALNHDTDVVSFTYSNLHNEWDARKGMLYKYLDFNAAFSTLRSIHVEINQKKETENVK